MAVTVNHQRVTVMSLTATQIRNLKAGKKPLRLYDTDGLYLELAPAGGKWWRFAYRFNCKRKLLSLGVLRDVSLAAARKRRNEARDILDKGIDPSEQRKATKRAKAVRAANSFEAVAREWYGKRTNVWVASHSTDVLRRLEANLFPELGDASHCRDHGPGTARQRCARSRHRGAHDLSHRVLQVASQVFRYGVATGRCERDPAPDLRGALTPHNGKHQAAVTLEELPALLRAVDGYGELGDKLTGYRCACSRSHSPAPVN